MAIPHPDAGAEAAARARQDTLTKPPGSLGRLEDLACWFAGRLRDPLPELSRVQLFVFAADHGVAHAGVSAFPQSVTAQMLSNFANRGAAVNVLAGLAGCKIEVVDVGVAGHHVTPSRVRNEHVGAGTRDLLVEAAMDEGQLNSALDVGRRCAVDALERGAQLLVAGDMGIANTTSAACLISAFTGAAPADVVGRGTGIDDVGLARKRDVVTTALGRAFAAVGLTDASNAARVPPAAARRLFAQLGGFEIAAMAGLYMEGARNGVPVLLDGYISSAAALAAVRMEPDILPWMLASHQSAESGHGVALQALRLEPLIDLKMRLGEGTGAVLSLPIIQAALALHRDMATFTSAGVDGAIQARPDHVARTAAGNTVSDPGAGAGR